MRYKDNNPINTIETIMNHFFDFGLTFKEFILNNDDAYPSIALLCRELGVYVNGKGSNILFARASAYAEFYERFYNNTYFRFNNFYPSVYNINVNSYNYLSKEETIGNIKEFILNNYGNEKCNDEIINVIYDYVKTECVNNKVPTIFFKNSKYQIFKVPTIVADYFIGTNGMASGNSYEEAYMQAFSEIIERKAIRDIDKENINIKKVPIEDIKSNSDRLYNKIIEIQNNTNYKIKCITLEQNYNYPIVAIFFIDTKNLTYNFKFGAHWNIYFALERCMSEILQGCNFDDKIQLKDICSTLINNKTESFKIFMDGRGLLSNKALIKIINADEFYKTKWNCQTNKEAYDIIKNSRYNIYEKIYKTLPLVSLQLYIPEYSIIRNIDVNEIIKMTDKRLLTKSRYYAIGNNYKEQLFIKSLTLLKSCNNSKLSDIFDSSCPIEKQYFNKIRLKDIKLFNYFITKDYSAILSSFQNDIEDSNYLKLLILYLEGNNKTFINNATINNLKDIKYTVMKDINSSFERILNIQPCTFCEFKDSDKCINNKKIKLNNVM